MLRLTLGFLAGAALTAVLYTVLPLFSSPPPSPLISEAAQQSMARVREDLAPHMGAYLSGDVPEQRAILDEHFYAPRIAIARQRYPVTETPLEINGVYTEVFTPAGGISPANAGRVLINLHGGAFTYGARSGGRLESIPVAATAGMKVISVDYRQGPEHRFPAASEDVATVYRHLLQTYAPENIGIFGCSAGGLLTAQSVAWFDANDLPQPGAIGIFCSGAGQYGTGDAAVITRAFGTALGEDGEVAYFEGQDLGDPLVLPQDHPALLARFPPTLLITSTRDGALSTAAITHQRLVGAGVRANLHVYEGLHHFFFADTDLPESEHLFQVIARFFDSELGGGGNTGVAP
ncbi:alpha/beta hydrolase [Pseudohalioglobus sediminis]|uniref:Alpha/beta hydrolase n=1 Tax=Pseudohalioglobus sediminis TaxID=2606449 RepID=A0A5B0WTI3_9GAMM|nr:alpha/beta hydrolase fold domain-containing protein [Pseudohalioglobus sediminis]KAA1189605.1 alpha/beta hydrolase [Pseudohalioglobus sediminis]